MLFYDRMTVHRKKFLVNKTNRCTEFQFYWYYDSKCFGQPFCPSSKVLAVQRLWYILYSTDHLPPGVEWYPILFLVTNGHNSIKMYHSRCTLRNRDDGQKGCPKHVES